jgi:hypothetical protein
VYVKPDVLRELHDRTAAFIGESVAGQ